MRQVSHKSAIVSDILPDDYILLHWQLLAKPAKVLAHFSSAGIEALCQVEGWDDLKARDPQGAARIIFVAATMGIPETI